MPRESAGEDLAADAPLARVREGNSLEEPQVVVGEAAVDRPENSFHVAHIEDIRAAVGLEFSVFALGLLLKQCCDMGKRHLNDRFTAEPRDDRTVDRTPAKFLDSRSSRRYVALDEAGTAQEPLLEVAPEPERDRIRLSVRLEKSVALKLSQLGTSTEPTGSRKDDTAGALS